MKEASDWKIAKWPFLTAFAALVVTAELIVLKSVHPISNVAIETVVACVALGALLGCLPFILEYRAVKKLIEVNAVGTGTSQLNATGANGHAHGPPIAAGVVGDLLIGDASADRGQQVE